MINALVRLILVGFVISVVARLSLLAFLVSMFANGWLGERPVSLRVRPPCGQIMVLGSRDPS
jgi:hypothetical protein